MRGEESKAQEEERGLHEGKRGGRGRRGQRGRITNGGREQVVGCAPMSSLKKTPLSTCISVTDSRPATRARTHTSMHTNVKHRDICKDSHVHLTTHVNTERDADIYTHAHTEKHDSMHNGCIVMHRLQNAKLYKLHTSVHIRDI